MINKKIVPSLNFWDLIFYELLESRVKEEAQILLLKCSGHLRILSSLIIFKKFISIFEGQFLGYQAFPGFPLSYRYLHSTGTNQNPLVHQRHKKERWPI